MILFSLRHMISIWKGTDNTYWITDTVGREIEMKIPLQWRHNERDGVSNHQPRDCLLNRLFRRRSKKKSKLRVTGLCENSPVTGEFPSQRASNTENVSIWWRRRAFGDLMVSHSCSNYNINGSHELHTLISRPIPVKKWLTQIWIAKLLTHWLRNLK